MNKSFVYHYVRMTSSTKLCVYELFPTPISNFYTYYANEVSK